MEMGASAIIAMFSLLIGGFVTLFGWTLNQINRLGGTNAAMTATVEALVSRIDTLVLKLDANFSIQITEQVARNVLQEKVANLERQTDGLQRTATANAAALVTLRRARPGVEDDGR